MTSRHRITLLPGDGIGPEIMAVARQLLDAVGRRHQLELEYNEQ
ncbi:MAG: isocitrate/isopropylmalate family dehydrogenase, partial [Prochlorococcaceae cyanobacterium]